MIVLTRLHFILIYILIHLVIYKIFLNLNKYYFKLTLATSFNQTDKHVEL